MNSVVGLLFPAMLFLAQLSAQPFEWLPAATWLSLTLAPTLLLLRHAAFAIPRARNIRG